MNSLAKLRATLVRRLHPEPNTGRWLFEGAHYRRGLYMAGIIRHNTKTLTVGRAAYIAFKGPVPDDKEIAHSCDVGMCGNPDHLRIASHAENARDMSIRFRQGLTKEKAERFVALRAAGLSYSAIMRETGCSYKTVGNILKKMGVVLAPRMHRDSKHSPQNRMKISIALSAAWQRRRSA